MAEIVHPGDTVEVSAQSWSVDVTAQQGSVEVVTGILDILPAYAGSYEITPSDTAQVLPTTGRGMASDIVVKPIPSNYGLITWDGSTLTVS